jgi:hypothetical protein
MDFFYPLQKASERGRQRPKIKPGMTKKKAGDDDRRTRGLQAMSEGTVQKSPPTATLKEADGG